MIIKFKEGTKQQEIELLRSALINKGFAIHESIGATTTIFGVIGDTTKFDMDSLYAYDFVDNVLRVQDI